MPSRAVPSTRPRLWVFNLDAELELERNGPHYQAPLRVQRALAPMLAHARQLMAPGDASVDDETRAGQPTREEAWLGAAWCPTPSALRQLSRAGAELPPSPSSDILRRVNHRRFYVEQGGGAPGARYVSDPSALRATLAEATTAWLFKRPFGFAGRGQRRIIGTPTRDDLRWLDDGLRLGGFVAEPWLELTLELGLHALIDASGRLALGQVCVQETDRFRAWIATRRARPGELTAAQLSALVQRIEGLGEALFRAGYFGPFGVDSYLYAAPSGTPRLNPLGELNARYSMGFAIGNPRFDSDGAG